MLHPTACAALLLLTGCAGGGLRSKSSNPTAPAAALDVQGAAGPMQLAVGGESRQVELRGNDSLVLTGTARDSRGIKDIVLQGNAVVTCSDPATGAAFTRSTGFLRRHVPGSVPSGSAPSQRDSRFVLRVGDIARLCPDQRLESAVGQARLQASNYRGDAAATPHLEFRIAVGEAAAQAIPMPGTAPVRTATVFSPEAGVGGSGGPARPAASAVPATPMAPRMCPRTAAPGHAAESRTRGDECLDSPVPSLSPPAEAEPPGASPPTSRVASPGASRHGPSMRGTSRRSASLRNASLPRAQRTQIGRL